MKQTNILLVGGFLGAGKTTLMARAASMLADRDRRVALITNDQAPDLVDTAVLSHAAGNVAEIAGGCFCCRFKQLIETANRLVDSCAPDYILGEPVGSCTDLSATVAQPIKDLHPNFTLCPLSILADPKRLRGLLGHEVQIPIHPSAMYILGKQLEEADIIVINKADMLADAERNCIVEATTRAFPGKPIFVLSALTGAGVEPWLNAVTCTASTGKRIVAVDYDIYAEGEAVLGWLNAAGTVQTAQDTDWQFVAFDILQRIRAETAAQGAAIAHVKLSLTADSGQTTANLTSTNDVPAVHGKLDASERSASLILNARVELPPDDLQKIVEHALNDLTHSGVNVSLKTIHSLSPGRPEPTHRYADIV
jgi:Ni2+-binding GTPase involved in maturation of urease and hydrogenase